MIEQQILKEKLQAAKSGWQGARTHGCYFAVYLLCSAICLFAGWKVAALPWMTGRLPWWGLLVPVAVATLLAWWVNRRLRQRAHVVRVLEEKMPGLDGLLLTAHGLLEKPSLNVLEHRVISAATDHAASHDWAGVLTRSNGRAGRWLMFFGLLMWVNSFLFINRRWTWAHEKGPAAVEKSVVGNVAPVVAVTVTPGDVEIERGGRLIVEAKFEGPAPAEATLVVKELDGQDRERLPMRLTVDQQVFGSLVARVNEDARYHVEYGQDRSLEHRITTFVYPALERADVRVTPPSYTGLPIKEIKNTLKVTAMEGSELGFTFKINKPVKAAELFGEDKTVLPLVASSEDPTILKATLKAEKTQKWRLHLVDDKERANKNPPWISVQVQSNQLAKIEIVFPKRDIQVSALQELPVEAKVWDDLGVTKSGVSFSIAGKNKEVVFSHAATLPARKQDVKEMLALEQENAVPRQLVSYHFWAEDKGPQGEVRRAMSDMFFADVRHFEDIFREAESQPGMEAKKSQTDQLVELQKQVVNATWKLIRDTNAGRAMEAAAPDVSVVRESQTLALAQTKEAMEETDDAEIKTSLTEAWKSMKDALDPLGQAAAEKKRAPLNQALTFEQSAMEWLHRAQSREHQVMRQSKNSPPSSAQKSKENQIMNLELKQEEQRYEEEKQASTEQTAEQQENLQVLNRLKELARRQEALAEKMKELQKQMEKAKSEEEKAELANQLKRLQDEQEQLLRDLDGLKERMETSANAPNMAEAKEQLEQTREQVMEAAEKLKQQQLADAANAATRAQRELEKMEEDFKQKTAKRFADEMKQVRQEARQVAENQKPISQALENQKTPSAGDDTSGALEKMLDGSQVAREIENQSAQVKELLENMRRLSEQAEGNNPLLHRRLYEAVRDAQTGGLEENLEEARMQSRYGNRSEAQDVERKAATSVDQLQKGVEKAAESVLGSETEALRMARGELDKLIDEVSSEAQAGTAKKGSTENENADGPEASKEGSPKASATASSESAKGKEKAGVSAEAGDSKDGAVGEDKKVESQMAGASPAGEQPGQGQNSGSSPGQQGPQSGGDSQGQQPGQTAQAPSGQQPGQAQQPTPGQSEGGAGKGASPGTPASGGRPSSSQVAEAGQAGPSQNSPGTNQKNRGGSRSRSGSVSEGRDGGGAFFFDDVAEQANDRPLTGAGYQEWTDRLRNVEELLNQPDLRNEAAKVLDNARAIRIDHERNDEAPQVDNLQMRITQPLVELRNRVAEELAKRDTDNPMVPVDRDPVPPAFRDLVKRYYKELGNGN